MTLPVVVGAAGLVESALGFLTTSIVTGGSDSWDPYHPGSHAGTSAQAKADKVMRAAIAKLNAEAQNRTLVDIWVTAANQQAIWYVQEGLQAVADVAIPHTRAYAAGQAGRALTSAKAYADTRVGVNVRALELSIAAARAKAASDLAALRVNVGQINKALTVKIDQTNGRIVTAENAAIAEATRRITAAIAAVETDITAALNRAELFASELDHNARIYAADQATLAEKQAEAYTRTKIGDLIATEAADLTSRLDTVWQEYTTQVAELNRLLTEDDPAAAHDLSVIPDVAPATDAAAAAATIAAVTALIRTTNRCTVPNCRNLSKFGRDLAELAKLLEGGALLAFLIGLVADPNGGAHVVVDELGGIINGAAHEARSLIGV